MTLNRCLFLIDTFLYSDMNVFKIEFKNFQTVISFHSHLLWSLLLSLTPHSNLNRGFLPTADGVSHDFQSVLTSYTSIVCISFPPNYKILPYMLSLFKHQRNNMQPGTMLNAGDTNLRATISLSLRNLKPSEGKQTHRFSSGMWRVLT